MDGNAKKPSATESRDQTLVEPDELPTEELDKVNGGNKLGFDEKGNVINTIKGAEIVPITG